MILKLVPLVCLVLVITGCGQTPPSSTPNQLSDDTEDLRVKDKKLQVNKTTSMDEKGTIGKYNEDGFPVILNFINELPPDSLRAKFPKLTVISWKYDGSQHNGMPPAEINSRMITLEDALEEAMNNTGQFWLAYTRTGNNLKELIYYSASMDDFIVLLNQVLANHEEYPIEINFYPDPEWTEFKKLLKDFAEK